MAQHLLQTRIRRLAVFARWVGISEQHCSQFETHCCARVFTHQEYHKSTWGRVEIVLAALCVLSFVGFESLSSLE